MLAALTLALCTLQEADTPAPPAEAEPFHLTFGWPAKGSVRVREEVSKKGTEAETTYVLRWSRHPEGDSTRLDFTDFEFVKVNGMDASNPLIKGALAQGEALASAIPSLRIDPGGNLMDFEDFGAMIEGLLASPAVEALGAKGEEIASALRNPQFQSMAKASAAETWNAWVGYWVETPGEAPGSQTWTFDVETSGGAMREMDVDFGEPRTHRGLRCLPIRSSATADPDLLLAAMYGLLENLETGEGLPDDLPIKKIARVDTIEGLYTLDGVRPVEVTTTKEIRLWMDLDAEPQRQLETHRWVFEWSDLGALEAPDPGAQSR